MRINIEKTKFLTVSRLEEEQFNIVIKGREVKNAKNFKYLGSMFAKEEGNKRDILE